MPEIIPGEEPEGTPPPGESPLKRLDRHVAELQRQHPGWRVWYVPNARDGSVTWHAQRKPALHCGSSEDLAEEIARVDRRDRTAHEPGVTDHDQPPTAPARDSHPR